MGGIKNSLLSQQAELKILFEIKKALHSIKRKLNGNFSDDDARTSCNATSGCQA